MFGDLISQDRTLFMNIITDIAEIGASNDVITFADKIQKMLTTKFGIYKCKMFLTSESIDYIFNIHNGTIMMKDVLYEKDEKNIFVIGNENIQTIIQLKAEEHNDKKLLNTISDIFHSLTPIFLKIYEQTTKNGEGLLDIITQIHSAVTVHHLSQIVKKLKKIMNCNLVIPLLFDEGNIFTLTVTKSESVVIMLWKKYRPILVKGHDIFQEHCIITQLSDSVNNPHFLFMSIKKDLSTNEFTEADYNIQKFFSPIIMQSMSRLYQESKLNEAEDHKESNSNELLSLEVFVPDLDETQREEIIFNIANKLNIFSISGVTKRKVHNFVFEARRGYNDNPYHCWSHAVDVLRNTYKILESTNKLKSFDAIERLALFVACICHDIGHIGVGNKSLEVEEHPIGILFKGMGALEMFHCSETIKIFEKMNPKKSLIQNLTTDEKKKFWGIVIEMILSTDLGKNKSMIEEFKSIFANGVDFNNAKDRAVVLNYAIKCGDLSNIMEGYNASLQWGVRVAQENSLAEGKDKVTPSLKEIAKSQVWFINFCLPLFEISTQLAKPLQIYIDIIKKNISHWQKILSSP